MGDRSNIKVYFEGHNPIYLYGHWMGIDNYRVVKHTLAKGQRWDDPSYLCRMLFEEMTKDAYSKETGFGIAPYLCDNEHTIIGVDCTNQTVTFEDAKGTIKGTVSFQDFVDRKDKYSQPTNVVDPKNNLL